MAAAVDLDLSRFARTLTRLADALADFARAVERIADDETDPSTPPDPRFVPPRS